MRSRLFPLLLVMSCVAMLCAPGMAAAAAPTCVDSSITAVEGGYAVPASVMCSDDDGDPLTISAGADGPAQGILSFNGGQPYYRANDGASGTDEFTLDVSDGSSTVTVGIVVTIDPDVIVCQPVATQRIRTGTVRQMFIGCWQQAPSQVTYDITAAGDTAVASPSLNYSQLVIAAQAPGTSEIVVHASSATDPIGADATINVEVADDANSLPTCMTPWQATVRAGATRTLTFQCSDIDGDAVPR